METVNDSCPRKIRIDVPMTWGSGYTGGLRVKADFGGYGADNETKRAAVAAACAELLRIYEADAAIVGYGKTPKETRDWLKGNGFVRLRQPFAFIGFDDRLPEGGRAAHYTAKYLAGTPLEEIKRIRDETARRFMDQALRETGTAPAGFRLTGYGAALYGAALNDHLDRTLRCLAGGVPDKGQVRDGLAAARDALQDVIDRLEAENGSGGDADSRAASGV
jgi:hypothetical protein